MTRFLSLLTPLLLVGCAPHKTALIVSPPTVGPIQRIFVLPFQGTYGPKVTDEFVRQLLNAGLTVSENEKNADASLSGTVTDYKPSRAISVFLGRVKLPIGDQTVELSNPVLWLGDSPSAADAVTLAAQAPQIIATETTVSVAAQVTDRKSGRLLWQGDAGYEALDSDGALVPTVRILSSSLKRILPTVSRING